jgi:Tol biopolymer transport system component/DNA-binding winged helix-turn-helix (wHTH) protein
MLEQTRQVYEFDQFCLDVAKRQLLREGEVVPLYSKAFDLLLLLVKSNGRDLGKDEILESIWPGQILEESNLTVNISAVRRALGEKATQPRYLITIPGRGYRFVAPVRVGLAEMAGIVIESQTRSQITVEEEEVESGELAAVATPPRSSDGEIALRNNSEATIVAATQAKQIDLPRALRAKFSNQPALIIGFVLSVSILVLACVVAVRWIRLTRVAANRFQQIKLRQLTNDGRVINAAISPDGKLYVFAHAEKDTMSLQLGSIDGEAAIELVPPANITYRGISFAPDGGSIYYAAVDNVQNKTALYRLPLLGRVPVKLRENFATYFAISPDGKSIAIVKTDDNTRTGSVTVSNLDGSNERELVRLPAARGLLGRNLSWSPDGSVIALGASVDDSGSQGALFTIPASGGGLKQLTKIHWRDIERTSWLKDNSGIFMIGASQDSGDSRQVWLVDYPSGDFRRITSDLNSYDIGLSAASDGKNVLAVQHQQISNIWIAPADNFSGARQITFGAFNRGDGGEGIEWSANGKIIYTSMVANSPTIWIMDADGSNAKELTPPGAADSTPSVTADGRFIVFESARGGASDIWRMDFDGSSPKKLTSCGKNTEPSVSPDGRWVVYRSECDSNYSLWRVSIEGGEPVRLTDKPGSWPWVSPDNKLVACEYANTSSEKTQLAIIPLAGGTPTRIFDTPPSANFRYGIRWTSDGKAVTYRDWVMGIWRQPIDGAAAQRLSGLPQEKIFPYAWSRDGKFLAFTRGVEIRDVVLISSSN